jgi:hypothetical protein
VKQSRKVPEKALVTGKVAGSREGKLFLIFAILSENSSEKLRSIGE